MNPFRRSTLRPRLPGLLRTLLCALVFALVFASSLLTADVARAQRFVAQVDRDELSLNETLNLDVVYAERADTDAIDFEKALPDFTILSIRPSSQTRIENFHRSSQTSWQLTLMPKRTGTLRIPVFSIGASRTRPIDVRVTDAPQSPEQGAPLSAELSLDRERAFVGEQILLRITLSSARSVSELRGSPPEIQNAETTLVGQKEFQRVLAGKPFQINELTYAVFPQSPGPLEIESLQYTGTLRRTQLVVARTKARTIEILDPAQDPEASSRRPWFPASGVALASEWSADVGALRVGEPVTRTIQISAAGQHAAAITPLTLPEGPFKQYAEQPELVDTETATGILGTRTESVVIVPTRAGELRLPPIEVHWWSVEAQRWKVSRLPGETLQVAENDAALGAPMAPIPSIPDTAKALSAAPESPSRPDALTSALAAACVVLLACCVGLFRKVRRLEAAGSATKDPRDSFFDPEPDEARAFGRVLRSIAARDALATRRDLIGWARARWPDAQVTRLAQISDLTSSASLPPLLAALDGVLYRGSTGDDELDFAGLAEILKTIRREPESKSSGRDPALPPLYPN